jgi:hypothetical protein
MARLTDAERSRICELYRQRLQALDSERRNEAPWRTFEYVAGHVRRHALVVRDTLIAKGVIDPTPPRGVEEPDMRAIAADYLSGKSIRECADDYDWSYGTIRKVLVYKRVKFRGRGGRGVTRS